MKRLLLLTLASALAFGVGCAKNTTAGTPSPPTTTPQSVARDTAAALNGAIVSAQAKYKASCVANNKQTVCTEINRGVAAENTLITALDTYCGWSATTAPADPNATCVPVQSGLAALTAATTNAATLVTEIQAF